ncbi:MAG: hypothetical protein ND895_01950 [Pyrinomonadaceae bacterium]|nr:hypothetical protein [Pyrinomonadaceae bacterium]
MKLRTLHFDGFARYVFVLACSIVTILLWIRMYGGNRQLEGTLSPPIIIPAATASFLLLKFRRWWIGAGAFIGAIIIIFMVAMVILTPQIAPDAFSAFAVSALLYIILPALFCISAGVTVWVLVWFRLARRSLVFPVIAHALAAFIPIVYSALVFYASSVSGVPSKVFLDEYGRKYALTTLALRRRDPRLCFGDVACTTVLEFTSKFPSNCNTISPNYMRSSFPFGLWVYFDFSRCERADLERIENTFDDEYALTRLKYRKIRTEVSNSDDCSSIDADSGSKEMDICQAVARGDATMCERLADEARSECYLNLAIKYRNAKFCTSRYRHFEDASCYILVELANQDLVK